MWRQTRLEYETKYTTERNYEMLVDIYQQAIANGEAGKRTAGAA